ncbi:MAG: magnesium transporter [Sulfurovum sp.]|nr:magnesium transporter [Sulfurovum sp.]
MDSKSIDFYLEKLKNGMRANKHINDVDLADYLKVIKPEDEEKFFAYLELLPLEKRAATLIELPLPFQIDFIKEHDATYLAQIIEVLDSDDATDLYQSISKTDRQKSDTLFTFLKHRTQETIRQLIYYHSSEAGSLMQTEIFKVSSGKTVAQAIKILAKLKEQGIGTVQSVYVTDSGDRFIKAICIDDLLLEKTDSVFSEIINKFPPSYSVTPHDSINKTINMMVKYSLTSLAVVDERGYLLGQITHDDAVAAMQKRATKQIYNLNKLSEKEHIHESFSKTGRVRSIWLAVNLVNAIIASMVIGAFEEILLTIVALAVLMPIVANMAGTASVQTMTVVIRQMALGEINLHELRPVFIKELKMAAVNGILFGILSAIIAQFWFENQYVSFSIGLSMLVSFLLAGFLGVSVPFLLKKMKFDPAVASSVIVITLVDIIGFFSFLWFAQMIAL